MIKNNGNDVNTLFVSTMVPGIIIFDKHINRNKQVSGRGRMYIHVSLLMCTFIHVRAMHRCGPPNGQHEWYLLKAHMALIVPAHEPSRVG